MRTLSLIALMICLLASLAARAADEDEDSPKANFLKFKLAAVNGDRYPYGWVLVDGYQFGMGAQKLRPQEIYTVWMVKPNGEKVGVGEAPYSFETRESGEGKYVIKMPDNQIFSGEFSKVVIYHHPDHNPLTMEGMLPILEGSMNQ